MSNQPYPKLAERAAGIDMLLLDVDGVMTDGLITLDNKGIESKSFHVRDGMGISSLEQGREKYSHHHRPEIICS